MSDHDTPNERPTRAARRAVGDRSASLARRLMQLPERHLARLNLPESVQAELDDARRIKSPIARRRQERRLAGALRNEGLEDVEATLDGLREEDRGDARSFQRVERWRDRLVGAESGDLDGLVDELLAELPDARPAEMHELVNAARREKLRGKPKGAGRRLFRHLKTLLETPE
jgi:ribosome-associated protein